MPSAPGSRGRRIAIVVLSALLVVIGAVASVAIVVAIYFATRSASPTASSVPSPPPTTRATMLPTVPTQDLVVTMSSPVSGAHVFMGARDLGPLPVSLHQHELTGEPLIVVAAGHEPRVIRSELIIELMRTQPVYTVQLDETDAPDLVAYVRYTGQGLAHLPSGEDIGPVPGVVLIPVHEGETVETSIVVWDESGVETAPISLAGCAADRVCLLTAIPQPIPQP